ncbi:interleukin-1 beta [Ctenodactylus gundi]
MAVVPELSNEVMAYHSDENELLFEVDGPKQMKHCFQDLGLFSVEEGIELQISHQNFNKSFQQVVSLIVAVEKLSKKLIPCPQVFQDDDLRSLFSIIFEEEHIIGNTWSDDRLESEAPVRTLNCKIQDIHHKGLVFSDPCELKALHLNGENHKQQVVFSMSFVQGEKTNAKIPVALGLRGKNLYLSCVMKDKPTLQLEKVDPKQYPKKKVEKRFIFNKIEIKNKVEFESAEFPNWYISTFQEEHMPVFLGDTRGGQDITDFTLEFVP